MKLKKEKSSLKKSFKKDKETKTQYSLPTELSKPSSNIWDYGILIHAEKKIGKTSLCSMIPDSFFMMTQPGAKSFSLFQKAVTTWEAFKAYVMLLEKDKRFRCVILDHVDGAYKACLRFVCKRDGMDHPADEGYGKGWDAVNQEFDFWLNRLLSCNKGVVMLTHSVLKDVKTRTGNEYTKVVPTLSGSAFGVIEQNIDIFINLFYDGQKRMMQILGDDHVSAGHNIENHFRYKDGSRIRFIPMGKNKQEAYENLMKAFNNQLEKPVVKEKVKSFKKKGV
jgi:hypothetical protein